MKCCSSERCLLWKNEILPVLKQGNPKLCPVGSQRTHVECQTILQNREGNDILFFQDIVNPSSGALVSIMEEILGQSLMFSRPAMDR